MLTKFSERHLASPSLKNEVFAHAQKKLVPSTFSTSWHGIKFALVFVLASQLMTSLNWSRDFVSGNFWSVNYTSDMLPKWWCQLLNPFIKGYHWSTFQLHVVYWSWDSAEGGCIPHSTNNVYSSTYKGLMNFNYSSNREKLTKPVTFIKYLTCVVWKTSGISCIKFIESSKNLLIVIFVSN